MKKVLSLSMGMIVLLTVHRTAFATDPAPTPAATAGYSSSGDPNTSLSQYKSNYEALMAAKLAQQKQKSTAMVWTAAAAVCWASCTLPAVGEGICTSVNYGATGVEILQAKDLASGLMSGAATYWAAKGGNSCIKAGFDTLLAMQKYKSASQLNGTISQLETNLCQLNNTCLELGGPGEVDWGTGVPKGLVTTKYADPFGDMTTEEVIQQAMENDPSLPPGVASPDFAANFKKTTGQDLGDFLKSSSSPSQALQDMLGGKMDSQGSGALSSFLRDAENQVDTSKLAALPTTGDQTGGGGGGSGSGYGSGSSGSKDLDMNALLGLNKNGAGGAGGASGAGAKGAANRGLASMNPDTMSIFQRVSLGYNRQTNANNVSPYSAPQSSRIQLQRNRYNGR